MYSVRVPVAPYAVSSWPSKAAARRSSTRCTSARAESVTACPPHPVSGSSRASPTAPISHARPRPAISRSYGEEGGQGRVTEETGIIPTGS